MSSVHPESHHPSSHTSRLQMNSCWADPYVSPSQGASRVVAATSNHKHLRTSCLTGFRNGALWSLIIAVPTTLAIYGEYSIGRSLRFDPMTGASMRVELSAADVAYCILAAITTTLSMVCFPWAIVAGFVHMGRGQWWPNSSRTG